MRGGFLLLEADVFFDCTLLERLAGQTGSAWAADCFTAAMNGCRLRTEHGISAESREWRPHAGTDLARLIREAGPDWVLTHSNAAPHVIREAGAQGRRVALFIHELDDLRFRARTPDLIVCNSHYARRVIERVFLASSAPGETCGPVNSKRTRVRFACTRPTLVQYPIVPEPHNPEAMRRRYLTIIHPSAAKGRRVFEQLVRLMPDRDFLVLGGCELDIPWSRVAYLPVAVRMDEVYRATRILLHPALSAESFSRTVAEAASFGVPSIASNLGGLPEALGPGGVAVDDFRNPSAWFHAIRRVQSDYNRYAALALEHSRRFRTADTLVETISRQPTAFSAQQSARPTARAAGLSC
jgi:hypothetical protein